MEVQLALQLEGFPRLPIRLLVKALLAEAVLEGYQQATRPMELLGVEILMELEQWDLVHQKLKPISVAQGVDRLVPQPA